MAKRKNWTEEQIERAKPYLVDRMDAATSSTEFRVNISIDTTAMRVELDGVTTSADMNTWADHYLTEKGWKNLLNFLRVSKHRTEEKAKGEEKASEDKTENKRRRDAMEYVADLNEEQLKEFLKKVKEKQQRRAQRERRRQKEKARAEQQRQRRQQSYTWTGGFQQEETYTVKECRSMMQKTHPDKGGNAAEFQMWKERLDRAKARAKRAA